MLLTETITRSCLRCDGCERTFEVPNTSIWYSDRESLIKSAINLGWQNIAGEVWLCPTCKERFIRYLFSADINSAFSIKEVLDAWLNKGL